MSGTRLLLLELVNDDLFNQHRAEAWPFLLGWCRENEVPARWVSIPAGKATRPANPYVVERLADADLAALRTLLKSERVELIVTNEKLGARLVEHLSAHGAAVLDAGDDPEGPRDALAARLPGLAARADVATEALAAPCYDATCLGSAGLSQVPLTHVVAGPGCCYRQPIASSPAFRGVALDGVLSVAGCSFCVQLPSRRRPIAADDAIDVALLQVARFGETAPAFRRPARFSLESGFVVARLGRFLDGLLDLAIDPAELYLTARIDELLRADDVLRTRLPLLAGQGHSLHLWNVGAESFSPAENDRFNKGISSEQIEHATRLLSDLEARHPRAFAWRRYGGFGLIPFTPWTTLDDLELTCREMRRLGLADAMGGLITTRLQLLPGAALVALARHDGLLLDDATALGACSALSRGSAGAACGEHGPSAQPVENTTDRLPGCLPGGGPPDPQAEPDSAMRYGLLVHVPFEMSCMISWSSSELPWRFRDPDVAAVYDAVSRLFPPGAEPQRDPRVLEVLAHDPALRSLARDPIDALARLVQSARALPGATASGLLSHAAKQAASVPEAPRREGDAPTPGSADPALTGLLTALFGPTSVLGRAGISGYQVTIGAPADVGQDGVHLVLRRGRDVLDLTVARDAPGAPALARAGGLRITHAATTPVTTPERRRAVEVVLGLLERGVTKRAGASRR